MNKVLILLISLLVFSVVLSVVLWKFNNIESDYPPIDNGTACAQVIVFRIIDDKCLMCSTPCTPIEKCREVTMEECGQPRY
jgi:regulatory protein YycH of two-component signal transduction system YycFG